MIEFFELEEFAFECNTGDRPQTIPDGINVYPNPTTGQVRIESQTDVLLEVVVCDALGRRIYTRSFPPNGLFRLDLGHFGEGIYLLHLVTDRRTIITKLILRK